MRKRSIALLMALALTASPVVGNPANFTVKAAQQQQLNTNLLKNGSFNNGMTDWDYFTTEGGKGTASVQNGKLVMNVLDCGTVNYSMQAYAEGFQMYKNGVYELSFDISSSVARSVDFRIQLNGGDYTGYYDGNVKTSSTTTRVDVKFTMKEENDMVPRLCFSVGNCGASLPAHTVTLDNVELKLLDGSRIDYTSDEKKENDININQVGYKTDDKKIAVFRGANVGSSFSVVNTVTNKTVYTGTLSGQKNSNIARESNKLGDFSSVKTPGTYKIVSTGCADSYEFTISDSVYDDTFKDAMRFFYLQRCEEIPSSLGGDFAHPDCHTSKARIYGTNNYIDVSGGWHDAGDYGRYVVATSKAVSDIMLAYQTNPAVFTDNTNIPESGNGTADVLDELKGQFEWMLKMQDSNSGGVYHKVTCADFPAYTMPQNETSELIVCPISTTATGDFAACMALAYDTYKNTDAAFAKQCLDAAKKAWSYLSSHGSQSVVNPDGIKTGEYGDNQDRDERYYAAAALYYATGESVYHNAFKDMVNQGVNVEYGWQTVGQYGNVLYLKSANQDPSTKQKIESKILTTANGLLSNAQGDSYGISTGNDFIWGSNMVTLNYANLMMDAYRISGKQEYKDAAIEHVNYIYGKNPMGMSYVTGYGTVSPQNPHHRPSMAQKKPIPGAMVGGPNDDLEDSIAKAMLADKASAKCYIDHSEAYSVNEVDIYWNSALVLALAGMDRVGGGQVVTPTTQPPTTQAPTTQPPTTQPPTTQPPTTQAPTTQPPTTQAPTTQPPTTQPPTDGPVVQSGINVTETSNAAGNVNQVFNITNTGSAPIDITKLQIKFTFTKDDGKDMNFWCDNAAAQLNVAPYYVSFNSGVKAAIQKVGNSYELTINFTENVELAPNAGYVQLQTRYANADWSSVSGFKGTGMTVTYNGKVVQ